MAGKNKKRNYTKPIKPVILICAGTAALGFGIQLMTLLSHLKAADLVLLTGSSMLPLWWGYQVLKPRPPCIDDCKTSYQTKTNPPPPPRVDTNKNLRHPVHSKNPPRYEGQRQQSRHILKR